MSGLPAVLDDVPRLLDTAAIERTLTRLAHEIVERHAGLASLVLAGVRTRGVPLALRISRTLASLGLTAAVVELDARDYRDDTPRRHDAGRVALHAAGGFEIPNVDGSTIVVVDDVLFTGRTIRAALEALVDAGRPATVEVLALIDRGHRELPFRATYVGKNVPTAIDDRVTVRLNETDGVEGAWLLRGARV